MVKKSHGLGSVYWNESRNCWQAAFYVVGQNGETKKRRSSVRSHYDEAYMRMPSFRGGKMAL